MFSKTKARFLMVAASTAALTMLAVLPAAQAQDATPVPVVATEAADSANISGTLTSMGVSSTGDEIQNTRLNYFTQSYPNVDLQFSEGGFDAQQFLTAVASGNPPDLVHMDGNILGTYAATGQLMPLTDCIADIDWSQYRPAVADQMTLNGVVYGIPEFFNSLQLIINTKAVSDAGLTLDDINTTDWGHISDLNTKMTVGNGNSLTRMGFDSKLPEFLPLWAKANGADLLSADGKTAQLNDPKVIEALEFAVSIYDAQGGFAAMKAFRDTWDFFGANNQVAADQIGFWPMEQWYMSFLAGVSPDAPVAFKAFTDKDGNPLTYVTTSAYAIPVGSKNPEAACAFAKTVTSVGAWVAAAQARADIRASKGTPNTGVYTGNAAADAAIFPAIVKPSGNQTFDDAVNMTLSLQDHGFTMPANPAGAEFQQAWQDAVNRVLNGEQDAKTSLDQAQQEAQAALDAAWSKAAASS